MCDFNRLHGPHNGTLRDVAACVWVPKTVSWLVRRHFGTR